MIEQTKKTSGLKYQLGLTVAALGVVFGDIGTSPLYAMRECFGEHGGLDVTLPNILGLLSLIFWSLLILISLKYLMIVLYADNRGEGGVLALMSLVHPQKRIVHPDRRRYLAYLGLFGAALLYGDGMLTPSISVLSAVEGLKIATPYFEGFITPITVVLLFALFYFQKHGTAKIGSIFGPIIILWFVCIGLLGLNSILKYPQVLAGLNPIYAVEFLLSHGWQSLVVLGSVFLVATGGEALYADMGHFGIKPIKYGWFGVALPGLVLNYFGQGALLMVNPATVVNPFYYLAPSWGLYPLVGLATATTVIASQAIISGAFSITRQAIQLGYFPRVDIRHTSSKEIGQIYVPFVNWSLLISTIWLVLEFHSSGSLAAAYGMAVATTMVITTILTYFVATKRWRWSLWATIPLFGFLIFIDLGFLAANVIKIPHGGWFPLVIGLIIFTIMTTWHKGRQILSDRLRENSVKIVEFIKNIEQMSQVLVSGTAIFMTKNKDGVPPALIHNVKHNKTLHERVILLTVQTEEIPHVEKSDRIEIEKLGEGFYRVTAHYGFMETPTIQDMMHCCEKSGLSIVINETTFFLGRETLLASDRPGMAIWREHLFAFLSRNAQRAAAFYEIPADQVIEIGLRIEL